MWASSKNQDQKYLMGHLPDIGIHSVEFTFKNTNQVPWLFKSRHRCDVATMFIVVYGEPALPLDKPSQLS